MFFLKSKLITVAEAATILGVSRQTIYNLINSKKIRAKIVGNKILIEESEILRYKRSMK